MVWLRINGRKDGKGWRVSCGNGWNGWVGTKCLMNSKNNCEMAHYHISSVNRFKNSLYSNLFKSSDTYTCWAIAVYNKSPLTLSSCIIFKNCDFVIKPLPSLSTLLHCFLNTFLLASSFSRTSFRLKMLSFSISSSMPWAFPINFFIFLIKPEADRCYWPANVLV